MRFFKSITNYSTGTVTNNISLVLTIRLWLLEQFFFAFTKSQAIQPLATEAPWSEWVTQRKGKCRAGTTIFDILVVNIASCHVSAILFRGNKQKQFLQLCESWAFFRTTRYGMV